MYRALVGKPIVIRSFGLRTAEVQFVYWPYSCKAWFVKLWTGLEWPYRLTVFVLPELAIYSVSFFKHFKSSNVWPILYKLFMPLGNLAFKAFVFPYCLPPTWCDNLTKVGIFLAVNRHGHQCAFLLFVFLLCWCPYSLKRGESQILLTKIARLLVVK